MHQREDEESDPAGGWEGAVAPHMEVAQQVFETRPEEVVAIRQGTQVWRTQDVADEFDLWTQLRAAARTNGQTPLSIFVDKAVRVLGVDVRTPKALAEYVRAQGHRFGVDARLNGRTWCLVPRIEEDGA